jgi:hypothetical protein
MADTAPHDDHPDLDALQALRAENAELRRRLASAQRPQAGPHDHTALGPGATPVRHSGPRVVAGVGLLVVATVAATVVMYYQLDARPSSTASYPAGVSHERPR